MESTSQGLVKYGFSFKFIIFGGGIVVVAVVVTAFVRVAVVIVAGVL